jgi:hypothetical protein
VFLKEQDSIWENQSQKNGIRRFANADFRRDLDLSLTSTYDSGIDFTIRYLIAF